MKGMEDQRVEVGGMVGRGNGLKPCRGCGCNTSRVEGTCFDCTHSHGNRRTRRQIRVGNNH